VNDVDRQLALRVSCGLCKVAAGTECVNSVTLEGPRDEPHNSRAVLGRMALSSYDLDDIAPNAGSAS